MVSGSRRIRIGTRGSLLARTQAEWVAAQLRFAYPGIDIEIVIIQTTGDVNREVPFAAVGTRGMFVKEIEQALLDGVIDLGVHSLKDMPSEQPTGLVLACIPLREDARDALLSRNAVGLDALPHGARVGTSSVRRRSQLLYHRPDLAIEELRGNLDTRLRRLDQGDYDAIVLACAGLLRLGLSERITHPLSLEICVPAVGQGALALEICEWDAQTKALLSPLHDVDTATAVEAERGFQSALNGGCSIPAGAHAVQTDGVLTLRAVIASPDGAHVVAGAASGMPDTARLLGITLAERLLAQGGRTCLEG